MAYRVLLVGAGSMGRAWAQNLLSCDRTELCGWVDIDRSTAERSSTEVGVEVPIDDDLERAIELAGPDFVVDVTVPEAHRDVTLTSLRHGLPVLGEKPMAPSMTEAREMVAASEQAGKLYMVSQNRRYNPRIKAFQRLVSKLGGAGMLNADFYLGPHFGGFRDEMASPLVLDMAIHTFDAARFISGADAVSVYCEEFNPSWSWYKGAASAAALFDMQGGLQFNYRGSWCAEGLPTSWDTDWRAVGPAGTAIWHGDDPPFSSMGVTVGLTADEPEWIAGSLADFLVALETGATPMGECHDNIKSLAMVHAAIEASRLGVRVAIEV